MAFINQVITSGLLYRHRKSCKNPPLCTSCTVKAKPFLSVPRDTSDQPFEFPTVILVSEPASI
eukprot:14972187-Ditylum_brightwellii.AAC.1